MTEPRHFDRHVTYREGPERLPPSINCGESRLTPMIYTPILNNVDRLFLLTQLARSFFPLAKQITRILGLTLRRDVLEIYYCLLWMRGEEE